MDQIPPNNYPPPNPFHPSPMLSQKQLHMLSMIIGLGAIGVLLIASYVFFIQHIKSAPSSASPTPTKEVSQPTPTSSFTFPTTTPAPTANSKPLNLTPAFYTLPPFPRSGDESHPAFYLDLSGAKNLTIKETNGKTYKPLFFEELGKPLIELNPTDYARVAPTAILALDKPEGITTYHTGEHSIDLIFDADTEYTISFTSSHDMPILFELAYGNGTRTELKVVYLDLLLDGTEAWFTISPRGVTQLRTNDKLIIPHAAVTGKQANDKTAPVVQLSSKDHDGQTEITLTATDAESTITNIMYSFDGLRFNTYEKPFFITTGSTNIIHAFAVDSAGNRSYFYPLQVK